MSADQLSALVAAVTADPKLAERFAALTSADEAVALAAELGFTVTADELAAAVAAGGPEISDAELSQAAGGGQNQVVYTPRLGTCLDDCGAY